MVKEGMTVHALQWTVIQTLSQSTLS